MGGSRALRVAGWAAIAAGLALLGYVAWALLGTTPRTQAAQAELLEAWSVEVGPADGAARVRELPGEDVGAAAGPAQPVEVGEAVAVLRFPPRDDGAPVVHDQPLVVTAGVSSADLVRGPGHYPGTVGPGELGNFAVAGHRTTYGAPFFHLDRLRVGDTVEVVDRANQVWEYEVRATRVVTPADLWVLAPDPLGVGEPTLTLTTCTPRFSDEQRLVVFAQLRR